MERNKHTHINKNKNGTRKIVYEQSAVSADGIKNAIK